MPAGIVAGPRYVNPGICNADLSRLTLSAPSVSPRYGVVARTRVELGAGVPRARNT